MTPTDLAILQDHILQSTEHSRGEALDLLRQLSSYEPLMSTQPNSNLKVRTAAISFGLLRLAGKSISSMGYDHVMRRFRDLRWGSYWSEGPSYFEYTVDALEWLSLVAGGDVDGSVAYIRSSYDDLVAPDGTLRLPEARATAHPTRRRPDYVSTPEFTCKRWGDGSYMLISKAAPDAWRSNLHTHPQVGYFALMVRGQWIVRCNPYVGWDPGTLIDSNGLVGLLPPGAVTPEWRLRGVDCRVVDEPGRVVFRWRRPWFDCVRIIEFDASRVRVVDKWLGVKRSVRTWEV